MDVPLYWSFIWFFTMKGVVMIHIFSKTWWEETRATDDAGISLVSNLSTALANNLLSSHGEVCNTSLERCCIIVGGR